MNIQYPTQGTHVGAGAADGAQNIQCPSRNALWEIFAQRHRGAEDVGADLCVRPKVGYAMGCFDGGCVSPRAARAFRAFLTSFSSNVILIVTNHVKEA